MVIPWDNTFLFQPSYKGQPLLSVFDPSEHPHLTSGVPGDTDPATLRPDTGRSELLQPGRAEHASVFPLIS